ncbi:MAG: hypothetical protein KGN02_11725 [bacterium]|nr:hypothetical protein [bacterium]
MRTLRRLLGFGILAVALAIALGAHPANAQSYGSTRLAWNVTPIVTLALTPNYQTGFGPQGGAGSGSTPAPGSGAVLGGGAVDFGNQVVQGYQYLYKYAVQAAVTTNDGSGFTLYAEGTNINDTTLGSTVPINQILYWLVSSGGNSPFSPATPFTATTSPTSAGCGGQCINYAGSPPGTAIVWHYPSTTIGQPGNAVAQGYDYQLRLGSVSNADSFSVYVTYTAVGN